MSSDFRAVRPATRHWTATLLQALSVQDFVIALYLATLCAAVLNGTGPDRAAAERAVLMDAAIYTAGLLLTRGELIPLPGFWRATLYRLLGPMVVFLSYFQLRIILPAVSSAAYDLEIYNFDMALFGVEPALAWDKWVTPARTEWFSFFYFGYFGLLIAYLSAMTFLCRDEERLTSFALGVFLVFTTGHLLYMVVPGYGPYAAMRSEFTQPLTGDTFWPMVDEVVTRGGALKDIFPSLHTAVPTFFALFSWRHRRSPVLRWLWPAVALFASQVVIATMYLRWHYVADVIAGLMLAALVDQVSARVGRWEVAARRADGRPPVYEPWPFPPSRK